MICIAIEEITNCDLKQLGDSRWEAADGFKVKWPEYLESVPDRTRDIMSSTMDVDEKKEAIAKLGTPAVPYVVDDADVLSAAEDTELATAVSRLVGSEKTSATMGDFATAVRQIEDVALFGLERRRSQVMRGLSAPALLRGLDGLGT